MNEAWLKRLLAGGIQLYKSKLVVVRNLHGNLNASNANVLLISETPSSLFEVIANPKYPITTKAEVEALYDIALKRQVEGQYLYASSIYRRLLSAICEWREHHLSTELIARVYRDFGLTQMDLGHISATDGLGALSCLRRAELLFEDLKLNSEVLFIRQMEGVCLGIEDNRPAALDLYIELKAALVGIRRKEPQMASLLRDIGINLSNSGDIEGARLHFLESARLYEVVGQPSQAGLAALEFAKAELKANNLDLAKDLLTEASQKLDKNNPLNRVKLGRAEFLYLCKDRCGFADVKFSEVEHSCKDYGFDNELDRLKRYKAIYLDGFLSSPRGLSGRSHKPVVTSKLQSKPESERNNL